VNQSVTHRSRPPRPLRTTRSFALLALIAAAALVGAACGNSDSSGDGSTTTAASAPKTSALDQTNVPVDQPGVTPTEIRVGGVASVTNPLGGKYGDTFVGAKAYFDKINSEGGIYGRQLQLIAERDDKIANNKAEVEALLTQDNVFAILPIATLLFGGADAAAASGTPTFGWTINPEWEGTAEQPKANLFGQAGSFLCLGCVQPQVPWAAKEAGATTAGILAYAVPQSSQCADGWEKSFQEYTDAGVNVGFKDSSLSYGTTDFSVQVSKMKDAGVDFIITCIDNTGVVNLAKELKKQGVDATQFLPNAYDQELLDEFGDLFEGSVATVSFIPLEVEDKPQGMQDYLEWIEKAGATPNENSVVGWLNAALLVEGLRQAGPEFTQQKVIDAINADVNWTADGFLSGVDWTLAHSEREPISCTSIVKVESSKFVPQIGPDGKPFVCFDTTTKSLDLVTQ